MGCKTVFSYYAYMKPLILLLAIAVCLPAGAAVNYTGKKLVDRPEFLNPEFTLNDAKLCIYDDESRNTGMDFTILDGEFNEISKFTTPAYPEVTAEYTVAQVINGPIGITLSSTHEGYFTESTPKFEFAQIYANGGYTIVEEHGDETWYLSVDEQKYFYHRIYGKQYPLQYAVWSNTGNRGFVRYFEYEYDTWGPTGQYYEPYDTQESETPHPIFISNEAENCFESETIVISQTLFNNDAYFEWIVYDIEAVDCSYADYDRKIEGKRLLSTGFRVESQNGSVVASVKFPAELYGAGGEFHLYMINGKKYLLVNVRSVDYKEYYYMVYEIDTAISSIKAVGAPRRVSVAPTTPRRGTDVNINLGTPAEISCKVIVTSISGRTIMTRNIEPGKTSTTINTANFEKGVYIVTVSDGKTTRENTKIVVR